MDHQVRLYIFSTYFVTCNKSSYPKYQSTGNMFSRSLDHDSGVSSAYVYIFIVENGVKMSDTILTYLKHLVWKDPALKFWNSLRHQDISDTGMGKHWQHSTHGQTMLHIMLISLQKKLSSGCWTLSENQSLFSLYDFSVKCTKKTTDVLSIRVPSMDGIGSRSFVVFVRNGANCVCDDSSFISGIMERRASRLPWVGWTILFRKRPKQKACYNTILNHPSNVKSDIDQ